MSEAQALKKDVRAVTGNAAVAYAMKQINPDVVAAYPITPQTTVMEEFSNYVANGAVTTELVRVESEHSAMSASIGSAAAGARTMTSTSSQGLALMWEELYIAAGLRLPIVMINVNRALSAPINIHCDHSDSMGARDAGWIQLFCENAQEAYDTTIMAVKLAEDRRVLLPVMVLYDGFTISHAIDRVEFLPDEAVQQFVGPFDPAYTLLDRENPMTVGAFDSLGGWYYEFKKVQTDAINASLAVMNEIFDEFERLSGRRYAPVETEQVDDADIVFVIAGSMAGSVRERVAAYRDAGMKVGLVKVRSFRPFPHELYADALKNAKAVLVYDRSVTPGAQCGPLALEVRSALYGRSSAPVLDIIYGLGGRDLELDEIDASLEYAQRAIAGERIVEPVWISLKDPQ
jgi:pyruvate ferredoxin oxidoreductase alpha subunit